MTADQLPTQKIMFIVPIVLIYKHNRYHDINWVCQCFISWLFRFINFRFYNNRQLGCDVRYEGLRTGLWF